MDINQAVVALEGLVTEFADESGLRAREVKVRPSGDDAKAIKIWVDLGPGVDEETCARWGSACRLSVGKLAGEAAGFTLEVRVESL